MNTYGLRLYVAYHPFDIDTIFVFFFTEAKALKFKQRMKNINNSETNNKCRANSTPRNRIKRKPNT